MKSHLGSHFNRQLARAILAVAALLAGLAGASAHPHVWVTMLDELVYAPDGSITGLRYAWTFDDMFSAFATQGIEGRKPGQFSREELMPLAKENVTSLKDFGYFTFAKVNGKKVELKDPTDYYLDYNAKDTVLTLHFTVQFKTPIRTKELDLEIYDPEYFVDFGFKDVKEPVTLAGAPAGCKLTFTKPKDLTVAPGQQLGEAFFNALTTADNWGAQFANKISVKCP